MGTIDHPFNPLALCLGADATFIARCMDRDPVHMREILKRGNAHKGTSLIEIYQNCNVFNDGAFELFTEKATKKLETIFVEHGKPLVFGKDSEFGIVLNGDTPCVVNLAEVNTNDLWIHDETNRNKANILVRFFDDEVNQTNLPRPFGVFYTQDRPCYEDQLTIQHAQALELKGTGNLDELLRGKNTWTIE